jgi:hypothetical protein
MRQKLIKPHRHKFIDISRKNYSPADHSFRNKQEILESNFCGCYHCLAIFPAQEVCDWWYDMQTATCPYCRIDSVVGDKSGIPINEETVALIEKDMFGSPDEHLERHQQAREKTNSNKEDNMKKECLIFLCASRCLWMSIEKPFIDVHGIAYVKELIKLQIEENSEVEVFVYDKAFSNSDSRKIFFDKHVRNMENSIGHAISELLSEELMLSQMDNASLEDRIEEFSIKSLKIDQKHRDIFFVDANIEEDTGWEYQQSKGGLYLIKSPGREIQKYSTTITVERRSGPGISISDSIEAENLEDLKACLVEHGLRSIHMESLSPFDDKHRYKNSVQIDSLTQRDYLWLTECVDYEQRYMVI